MLACDFLTVETAFLQRIYVLFFISLATRRIEYIACTPNPDGDWVSQQARNLVMQLGEQQPLRFLVHDRGLEVQPRLRRGLPDRRHQSDPHTWPGADTAGVQDCRPFGVPRSVRLTAGSAQPDLVSNTDPPRLRAGARGATEERNARERPGRPGRSLCSSAACCVDVLVEPSLRKTGVADQR
jgi:hypothetical protein